MPLTPPVLQYVERFTVTGLKVRTQNSDEFNEKTAKIPGLWQQFNASDLASHTPVYGVYSDYESNANGLYTLTVGVIDDHSECVEFDTVNIPAGNYLVFRGEGPMPLTVVETWQQIWKYFEAEQMDQRSFISDFEEYSGSDKVAIYIGMYLN